MEKQHTRPPRSPPALRARAEAELAARREREAAALRANLRRRKEQARAQEAKPSQDEQDTGG
jgi:hypothetical protein